MLTKMNMIAMNINNTKFTEAPRGIMKVIFWG